MSNINAVSAELTDTLTLDLETIAENTEKNFQDMDDLMDSISDAINGDILSTIKSKYLEIQSSFPIIVENMKDFSKDFKTVKINYDNKQSSIATADVESGKEREVIHVNKF